MTNRYPYSWNEADGENRLDGGADGVAAGRHPPPSELSHLILQHRNSRLSCKQAKNTHGYKYTYI